MLASPNDTMPEIREHWLVVAGEEHITFRVLEPIARLLKQLLQRVRIFIVVIGAALQRDVIPLLEQGEECTDDLRLISLDVHLDEQWRGCLVPQQGWNLIKNRCKGIFIPVFKQTKYLTLFYKHNFAKQCKVFCTNLLLFILN